MNYTVTSNTVIEFEFSSSSQGEIHGVGFENDNSLTSSRYFKVHGTQSYGITNFDNYTSGTVSYTIPVGNSYTGSMSRLVFINDNDAGSGNNSIFSNVRIYEGSCENPTVQVAEVFNLESTVLGHENEEEITSFIVAPNPVKKGGLLQINGYRSQNKNANYRILNLLGQVVIKGKLPESNSITLDNLDLGVYILHLENGIYNESKRFIIE